MRVLVTGGAGFLGTNLCRALVARGDDVISYDIRGPIEPVAGVEYVHRDVANPEVPYPGVDEIYHLACDASPAGYMARPIRTLLTAVAGTVNVLRAAERRGARILVASTSEVYGDPERPMGEAYHGNVNPWGPRAVYDEGKRAAEAACWALRHDVDIRLVRIFNTYGPGMAPDDGRMIPNFVIAALRGEPMRIYGGLQTRTLCYVGDMVEGFLTCMACDPFRGPMNLGGTEERTVEAIARAVAWACGTEFQAYIDPPRPDDPETRKPVLDLARAAIGWAPRVGFDEGISQTIEWFRRVLAAGASL